LRIVLEKYSWANTTVINEVNFFGLTNPTLTQSLTVHNNLAKSYLVKDSFGDVNYDFANVDENNSLYFSASSLSFQLLNAIGQGEDLDSFFEIYTTDNYIKFKLFIYDDSEDLIYTAIISKDGVSYANREQSIISVLAVGYEKEFKEYYSNVKMVHPDSIDNENSIKADIDLTGLNFKYLSTVIGILFERVSITFPSVAGAMWVADKPYIYSPLSVMSENDLFECKSGLINFYNAGMTSYEYLNFMCLSMGWIWFFYLDRLIIRPAYDVASPELVIDYNETFLEHSIENTVLDFTRENIVIECGEYYSNQDPDHVTTYRYDFPLQINLNATSTFYTGGQKNIVYSLNNNDTTEINCYRSLLFESGNFYFPNFNNHTSKVYDSSDRYFRYYKSFYTTGTGYMSATTTYYNYSVNNSIVINTGVTGRNNGSYLDTTNARGSTGRYYGNGNSLATTNAITDVEIGYTGSVGESVIYKDIATGKYYNYDNLMKFDFMKKNFLTYVSNNINVLLGLRIKALITNPLQVPKLLNYVYANINNIKMTITQLGYNIFSKLTNIRVQYSNE